ncbi:hypothetical protein CTI12_AA143550 [Artemisia annua]|uniref:RNA-directed DNA polymerase, eukaryota, Reverse transcriptase zinc-binding domain protein n=1 Tax=Artemisia annua TaxID=35608 RepID=A0A2U1PJH1_ARTAN|nr:hypothetical protein CTI12_AA143550 [Artemisia annua]
MMQGSDFNGDKGSKNKDKSGTSKSRNSIVNSTKETSFNTKSSVLGEAPIMKSILKKTTRNVPSMVSSSSSELHNKGNQVTTGVATLEKIGTDSIPSNDAGVLMSNQKGSLSSTSELNVNNEKASTKGSVENHGTDPSVFDADLNTSNVSYEVSPPGTSDVNTNVKEGGNDNVSVCLNEVNDKDNNVHQTADVNKLTLVHQTGNYPKSFVDIFKDNSTKKPRVNYCYRPVVNSGASTSQTNSGTSKTNSNTNNDVPKSTKFVEPDLGKGNKNNPQSVVTHSKQPPNANTITSDDVNGIVVKNSFDALNDEQRPLWHNLLVHKHYVRNRPWCLLGDFNSTLNLEDKVEGSSVIDIAMREFKECVDEIEVFDVNRSRLQFTWNQKPRGTDGTLKKIDRIMANIGCTDGFVFVRAIFQPYRISDHSPAILTIPMSYRFKPRPFKFSTFLFRILGLKCRLRSIGTCLQVVFTCTRVPKTLCNVNKSSYTPRVVSIGHFHAEEKGLKGVEMHKVSYMCDLFRGLNSPLEETMKACVNLVLPKLDQIKACYQGEMKEYDNNEYVKMMHAHATSSHQSRGTSNSASEFLNAISYLVTDLTLAGVKLKPNTNEEWLLDMEFKSSRIPFICWSWRKPTFKMPYLQIEDYTESVLRNLIAYEQCSPMIPNYVTSYAFAMERILDAKEDVHKLIESKVLVNNLGSSEHASNMINIICKEVTVNDFTYIKQWQQLEEYYNGYWPKNVAWLRRTYFNTPWSFIALLAGFLLFGLTVAQTYFTIRPP